MLRKNLFLKNQQYDRQLVIKQTLLYQLTENAKEVQYEFKENLESMNH